MVAFFWFENDTGALGKITLHGRLTARNLRHDDLALIGGGLALHDEVIARQDARFDHGLTANFQTKLSPRPANCSGIDMSSCAISWARTPVRQRRHPEGDVADR